VKIVNNRGQFKITIPKDIIDSKGWNSEMRLRFVEDLAGNIILRPIEQAEPAKDMKNIKDIKIPRRNK
jgi:bifunctional DNA-binding transcriptional regulator/antitoxin component of YhaV-PrlF toxin-antitoxin module